MSRLEFEHPTFRLRGERSNPLRHRAEYNIPIYALCFAWGQHEQYKKGYSKNIWKLTKQIQKDLKELEKSIYPRYQEAATNTPVQRADVNKRS